MHARVTTLSFPAEKLAEGVGIYQQSVLPALQATNGFKGCYLLTDAGTGKALSITVWESEADGIAYESSGSYREQVGKVAALLNAPPSLATYDVGAQA
ncbi:MAG: hypothetical protein ABI068_01945 [Ktedonobacterales bacterium]